MQTPATKQARRRAHRHFDKLWKTKKQRREAYRWLAKEMGLSAGECHIGQFSSQQCDRVIELVKKKKPNFRDGRIRNGR